MSVPAHFVSLLGFQLSVDEELELERAIVELAQWSHNVPLCSFAGADEALIDVLLSGIRISSVGTLRTKVRASRSIRVVTSALGRTIPSPSCSFP